MFRLFAFLFIACLAAVTAVWVAEQSGDVRLLWQGYLIETSVSVFIGVIIFTIIFAALIIQLVRTIVGGPRALLKGRRQRAEARGYKALMRGMVAVAAGDVAAAKRELQRVQSLDVARPLSLLLSAQCYQLAGDELAADGSFRAMLSEPESEFLGLRGLLVQALRNGEVKAALDLARRAYEINPQAQWVLQNLIELETRTGNWPDAERSVITAERRKMIDPSSAQRRRALILFQQARLALDENSEKQARNFVLRAVRLRPTFVPAVKLAAELLVSGKRPRRAKSLLKRAWEGEAHPDFAELYVKISEADTPLERLKILDSLVSSHSNHPEALLLTANAALDASLWGTARKRLGKAMEGETDQRFYRLMARLEQSERGNEGGARQWLLKATRAKEQPQWNCQVCGVSRSEWIVQCPSCESIDAFEWNLPGRGKKAELGRTNMLDESLMESEVQRLVAKASQAQASVNSSELSLSDTIVYAPQGGIISNRKVEPGMYLEAGWPMMSLVPLQQTWVIANFKETQLENVQAGQTAVVKIDAFPHEPINGHVDSIAPASAAEFSLLPPQNTTGNFIKVVQRIPVRILYDLPPNLQGRVVPGMSVLITIDTGIGSDTGPNLAATN